MPLWQRWEANESALWRIFRTNWIGPRLMIVCSVTASKREPPQKTGRNPSALANVMNRVRVLNVISPLARE